MKHLDEYDLVCGFCDVAMSHCGFNFIEGLPVYHCLRCGVRVLYDPNVSKEKTERYVD